MIVFLICTNLCNYILYYKLQHTEKPNFINQKERPVFKKIINTLTKYYLILSGVFINYHRLDDDKVNKVYKKYFGPDYEISYDEKFSIYICNHISFCDMMMAMRFLGCGFVSKASVKNSPILGLMNRNYQSVFVDRSSEKKRNLVLNEIIERQKKFLDGSFPTPIMIFPEGTTTSNRDIITFKKGAFEALLPIKPMMIKGNEDKDYHVGCGNSDVVINYLRGLCRLYQKIEYIEMPVMKPTKYMYENYKEFGNEKWEIYAKVSREIYCELGGFNRSKNTIRDNFRYSECMSKNCYIEGDDYKIKD
jgi:1-acyl-sn-glycerol-3-phosphate acyltransferase